MTVLASLSFIRAELQGAWSNGSDNPGHRLKAKATPL